MSNKAYDIFKIIALVILPAVTVFVGATLEALNVSCSGVVVTIMTAFDTMLGTIISKLSTDYYKNQISDKTLKNI